MAEQWDNQQDHHSFANVDDLRVTHLSLALSVDFAAQQLSGSARLTLDYRDGDCRSLYLDTRELTIKSVHDQAGNALAFQLDQQDSVRGQCLVITLVEPSSEVIVNYHTSPQAQGLQWLSPEQTSGKQLPFLFSQSQPINARSWVPLQDTPRARITFDAEIKVPKGMRAVMSAMNHGDAPLEGIFHFEMEKPIPTHLLAIAVGDLHFGAIGPRTGVYAEPQILSAAVKEFEDTEKMVEIAESLLGPYAWDRYDMLILPPSFPFGGMENPLLTFATPTLIAGDRSLVSVMAHELAHSWTGNLVTNATWADFWLNEGYTTYLERRLVEAIYGKEMADMQKLLGQRDLRDLTDTLMKDMPGDTVLCINLEGRHPDDGMTDIPYEKGANMLIMLETHFGREKFDAYLRTYFDTYAFQSITTEEAMAFMKKELFGGDQGLWDKLKIDTWVHAQGLPDNIVVPKSDKFEKTGAAAAAFAATGDLSQVDADWLTAQWQDFLSSLPAQVDNAYLA
uniref:M1 family aminopeptidase/hydrolase n=1 Tax=Shewanella sp. TaxID=50422 RepID=UPI003D101659